MQDLSPILPSPTAQDFGQESLRRAVRQCITDLAQRVGDSLHLLEALGGVVGKLQGFNPLTTAVLECVAEAALAVNYFSPKVCPFCGADMLCFVNSITRPSCMCLHIVSVTPCKDSWHRGGEQPSSLDSRHLTSVMYLHLGFNGIVVGLCNFCRWSCLHAISHSTFIWHSHDSKSTSDIAWQGVVQYMSD